jgi:hypothetical protein
MRLETGIKGNEPVDRKVLGMKILDKNGTSILCHGSWVNFETFNKVRFAFLEQSELQWIDKNKKRSSPTAFTVDYHQFHFTERWNRTQTDRHPLPIVLSLKDLSFRGLLFISCRY